jgi:hypothetical protein
MKTTTINNWNIYFTFNKEQYESRECEGIPENVEIHKVMIGKKNIIGFLSDLSKLETKVLNTFRQY